jgi:hypothetical protein
MPFRNEDFYKEFAETGCVRERWEEEDGNEAD